MTAWLTLNRLLAPRIADLDCFRPVFGGGGGGDTSAYTYVCVAAAGGTKAGGGKRSSGKVLARQAVHVAHPAGPPAECSLCACPFSCPPARPPAVLERYCSSRLLPSQLQPPSLPLLPQLLLLLGLFMRRRPSLSPPP